MEQHHYRPLTPWTSIWTRPRETIREIVFSNPKRSVLLLAALAGFSSALDRASIKSMGDTLDLVTIFGIAAIAGPIGGIISLYIGAVLLRWMGMWIGGAASSMDIRAAMAWSSAPLIWALLLWIPGLFLFGRDLFTSATPKLDASEILTYSYMGFGVVEVIVSIWSLIIFLKCLGEVQGFSAWKALGNTLLAGFAVIVLVVITLFGLDAMTKRFGISMDVI